MTTKPRPQANNRLGRKAQPTYSAVTDTNNQSDAALHFYLNDWVGTRRIQTDYAGIQEQDCSSLPFGDQLNCTQSIDSQSNLSKYGRKRAIDKGNWVSRINDQ